MHVCNDVYYPPPSPAPPPAPEPPAKHATGTESPIRYNADDEERKAQLQTIERDGAPDRGTPAGSSLCRPPHRMKTWREVLAGGASLLGHSRLAQAGEIGGFKQRLDLGRAPKSVGFEMSNAREEISAVQPSGFGKFGTPARSHHSEHRRTRDGRGHLAHRKERCVPSRARGLPHWCGTVADERFRSGNSETRFRDRRQEVSSLRSMANRMFLYM